MEEVHCFYKKSEKQRYKAPGSPLATEDNCSGHVAPLVVHLQSYVLQLELKLEGRRLIILVTLLRTVIKTHL